MEPTAEHQPDEQAAWEGELFRLLTENVKDYGIFITDRQRRVLSWSRGAERLLGYTEDEILGQTTDRFFTPEDIRDGKPQLEIEAALETGRGEDDRWHVRKDGERFWVSGVVTPLWADDGRLRGLAKIMRDLTEQKRAEEALREADRRKDEFLATLAHELRNPLAPLLNALQLMKLEGGDGRGIEAERALAERQARHMSRLIDDLMDISRISTGRLRLHTERLELCEMVRRAVESARPAIVERGHALNVELAEQPILLEADPTRLEQVIWNLLNNAAKYTEPGGRIDLLVERVGDEAVIRVRDTGVGIGPELLPRVFELFVQAESGSARSEGGLGIGLGLVRSLVELHGGTITAHSEGLGKGSEFVVRLPAPPTGEAPAETGQSRPSEASAPPARRRILIVDDNADAANVLAKLLTRSYGQEVRVAHDGPAGLEAAEAFRPDVVLLDIGLPGMDGHEVARRLRGRPEFERTTLVALTGWGQASDRERSKEAGLDHHLVKPVDPNDLIELLRTVAPRTDPVEG